jgi:hypothetical protein
MEIKHMSGIGEYLSHRFWDENTMIFRGVPNSNSELIPAIGRCKAKDPKALAGYSWHNTTEFRHVYSIGPGAH